jgi:hypothetical protein
MAMSRLPPAIAVLAAIGVAVIGVRFGTYAAGGSDSSCYALMAEAFSSGTLQPASALVAEVPWPDAQRSFAPGGFVPSPTNPSAFSPICAPGFSLLLATFAVIGGRDAIFLATPLAGALLVWLTYLAGRAAGGPLAGASAAVLIAASPAVLFQVVQPMNDVMTAALWMATYLSLLGRRWALAGVCCGLAMLVRPNLLPMAFVAGLFVAVRRPDLGAGARFALAALPFALLVLYLNNALYGGPLRSGYGDPGTLFRLSHAPINAGRYLAWLTETHTPFPLVAFAAPLAVAREQRAAIFLALGLIAGNVTIYVFYTPFDDWSYLRFLLPAIALMVVLASATMVRLIGRGQGPAEAGHDELIEGTARSVRTLAIAMLAIVVGLFCVRAANDRFAFTLQFLEQRYRSAGVVIRDRLPANAVVLSVWDSGAVRFHGRKDAVVWDSLDPAWLDRSVRWLDEQGRAPYILTESWEEEKFRGRFEKGSELGRLDWPAKYEIDRVVRLYDPRDRPRFEKGESVVTEYVWPLRDRRTQK